MRITQPAFSKEITKKINNEALEKTLKLLGLGKLIIIFPSGGEYEWLKKGRGLDFVKEECQKRKIKAKFIELKIKNFGELSLLFHLLFKTQLKAIIR